MFRMLYLLMLVPLVAFAQQKDSLPVPHATKSHTNYSNVTGWDKGETPRAPEGFSVSLYADDLRNPRWLCILPNGDVLVAESNTNHPLYEKIGAFFIGASKSNSMKNS